MMYKKLMTLLAGLLLLFASGTAFSMNMTRPYNSLIRAETSPGYRMQVVGLGQASVSDAKGFDEDGCRVNVLRIWNGDQNALKMLDGFSDDSLIGQRRILVGANDDGARGHYLVDGDLSAQGFALSGWWSLPKGFSVATYFPFYFMRLQKVNWCEQTKDITSDDARTKEYLTNDFFNNVCTFGDGLYLGDWKHSGFGDMSFFVEWLGDFKQEKKILKNVRVNGRAGLLIPTGKCRDEDKLFALPFGNDGAVGAVFGAGIDLTFGTFARVGLDVELSHVFANTRCRRIKTNEDQTELLLLAKTEVLRDFGLAQQFTLYAELYRLWNRLSFKAGYQFYRHGEDSLYLFDQTYSERIANTANSLEEWTMHNLFLSVSYNYLHEDGEGSHVHPYVSLFAKIPFNGKFSALSNTVGVVLSIDF